MSASSRDEIRAEIDALGELHPALAQLREQGIRVYRAMSQLQVAEKQVRNVLANIQQALAELRGDEPL